MRSKDRNKSLGENSMKLVVNIIKLSSFSIANMSLGAAGPSAAAKDLGPLTGSSMADNEPLVSQFSGSQKSVKPRDSSKPSLFVMEPSGGDQPSYVKVIHVDKCVDGMASEYIKKVHQRNQSSSETLNLSEDILPPPPSAVYAIKHIIISVCSYIPVVWGFWGRT